MSRQVKADMWGEPGARAFDDALNAAHKFAKRSGCPFGMDVLKWLSAQHEALVLEDGRRKRPK